MKLSILRLVFVFILISPAAFSQKELGAMARRNNLWGLIDQNGNEIIPHQYDIFSFPGAEWLPYNNESKSLIFYPRDRMVKTRKGNKYGFYDLTNNFEIPHQFQEAMDFKDDFSIVYLGFDYGIINRKGELLFEPTSRELIDFSYGRILFKKGNKHGYMDFNGNICIEPVFNKAEIFTEGVACVRQGNRYGYIDLNGDWFIEPAYSHASSFLQGFAIVQNDNLNWGVINLEGEYVIPPDYEKITVQNEGYFRVKTNGHWGFVDTTGYAKINCIFNEVRDFANGIAIVSLDGLKWSAINDRGQFLLDDKFEKLNDCHDGIILITENQLKYYIKIDGTRLNQKPFVKAYDFSEGLARVAVKDKIGFIDTSGEMVIQPVFDNAYDFKEGLCRARKDERWGYIDKKGDFLIKPVFDNVSDFFLLNE